MTDEAIKDSILCYTVANTPNGMTVSFAHIKAFHQDIEKGRILAAIKELEQAGYLVWTGKETEENTDENWRFYLTGTGNNIACDNPYQNNLSNNLPTLVLKELIKNNGIYHEGRFVEKYDDYRKNDVIFAIYDIDVRVPNILEIRSNSPDAYNSLDVRIRKPKDKLIRLLVNGGIPDEAAEEPEDVVPLIHIEHFHAPNNSVTTNFGSSQGATYVSGKRNSINTASDKNSFWDKFSKRQKTISGVVLIVLSILAMPAAYNSCTQSVTEMNSKKQDATQNPTNNIPDSSAVSPVKK